MSSKSECSLIVSPSDLTDLRDLTELGTLQKRKLNKATKRDVKEIYTVRSN